MPQESPLPCALPGWRATSRLGCQPGALLQEGEAGGERNPGELRNLPLVPSTTITPAWKAGGTRTGVLPAMAEWGALLPRGGPRTTTAEGLWWGPLLPSSSGGPEVTHLPFGLFCLPHLFLPVSLCSLLLVMQAILPRCQGTPWHRFLLLT